MQMGFSFDQTRCTGCFTCVVACKDWNDVDPGPAMWRRVITIENGTYPDLSVAFLSTACHHCEKPPCVSVCPVDAIIKRDLDGVVVVDHESCLGKDQCNKCLRVCPYDAPQFGTEKNAKMQKCNFCLDRISENKSPACVGACPLRALDAGPMQELRAKYGCSSEADGFVYAKNIIPSVVFKPKPKRT